MRFRLCFSLFSLAALAMAVAFVSDAAAASRRTIPAPVFARAIVVIPVSGTVVVTPPGRRGLRLFQARSVRSGSVLDVSKAGAEAEIEVAAARGRATYTANVSGGVLRVSQTRGGKDRKGVTNLTLSGRAPACDAAHAAIIPSNARVGVPGHGHRRRGAHEARSVAIGQFRLVGKDGSAVNSSAANFEGTQGCNEMTVADRAGTVTPAVRGGASAGIDLRPGKTWTSRCSAGAGTAAIGPYCVTILGTDSHGSVSYVTGLFAKTTSSVYNLCQTVPGQSEVCQPWALTTPDAQGYREGLVLCMPSQAGTYSVTWQLDGATLGAPLNYRSASAATEVFPCNGTAGTPYSTGSYLQGLPSGLKIVNSYTLPTASWLDYLTVDLKGQGKGKEDLSAVVYQDDGGRPGQLVASTTPCVVSGGNTSDCDDNGFIFSPNVNVPAGTYWFGLLSSGKSDIAQVQGARTALAYVNDNPLSAASDPFGAASPYKFQMSLQVNYTLDPPPGTAVPAASRGG